MAGRRLILDSGALSALAQGDPRFSHWVREANKSQMLVCVPAPVLAETYTGRPEDAILNRAMPWRSPDVILDTTGDIAREAGVIRYRAHATDKTIDAIIVATATLYPRSIILTSDPDDMTQLAAQRPDVRLHIRSVHSVPDEPR